MNAGDELYNYLLEHGPLPVAKVQKIFAQLVGAVSYVHKHSCVHRDLKLENILFDKHEDVKLVDFGFTREYEGRTNHLQTFCGTVCYSAPEMLKGEKYAGEKVDVWSLGIILYALLCGELPFDDDDDNITRTKILSEEPNFPEHMPEDAINLIKALLSKRPLPRPNLGDILNHPFLAEHAPAQQTILGYTPPPPFSTPLEKECLQRMRGAGVDIDAIIESVLAQKCNALAGWWSLLLEKEERKMKRRDRKRKERDPDSKSLRRLSAASSRLERMAPTLPEVDEDGTLINSFGTSSRRGRAERRSAHYYSDFTVPDLPQLPEVGKEAAFGDDVPPTPIDKDSIRSASTSRNRRPIPPPKEGVIRSARSRGSTLHLVTTTDAFNCAGSGNSSQDPATGRSKPRNKSTRAIIATWKNWTHWLVENTSRRKKGHDKRKSRSTPDLHLGESKDGKTPSPRPQTSKYPTTSVASGTGTASLPKSVIANGHIAKGHPLAQTTSKSRSASNLSITTSQPRPPRITTSNNYKRQSLSPSPRTPRGSVRRSSVGLRGRKSTSSSVSSVRSIHHHHYTHSKASSTSSTGSVSTTKTPLGRGTSPHHSVKVLPATPVAGSFPSNIRLVRATPAPLNIYHEGMGMNDHTVAPGSPNPFASGGVLFAKRKKNVFKGPVFGTPTSGTRSTSHSRNTSGSGLGRRSGEMPIQEEDEDDSGLGDGANVPEEEIEEVEMFAPIVSRPGELVEEHIIDDEDVKEEEEEDQEGQKTPTVA